MEASQKLAEKAGKAMCGPKVLTFTPRWLLRQTHALVVIVLE